VFDFKPDDETRATVSVPYFEDARASETPYYASRKSLHEAKTEVVAAFARLGAGVTAFVTGVFLVDGLRRHGVAIYFTHHSGAQGVRYVAGIPIRSAPTETKRERVLVQALLNVRDWLISAYTAQVFSPGSDPLISDLILESGQTVGQYVRSGQFKALPPPASEADVIEGEVVEL